MDGRIVFTGRSKFPKGRPPRVMRLDLLEAEYPASTAGSPHPAERYRAAWDQLGIAGRTELARARLTCRPAVMVGDDLRHADRQLFRAIEVQELVRPVRVRVRAEHAGDEELGRREAFAEHAMKGMVPPVPRNMASRPKWRARPRHRLSSHGASGGASQPRPARAASNVTRAPYGGSASSGRLTARRPPVGVRRGRQAERELQLVPAARSTLPAFCIAGRPVAPVTASVGPPGVVEHELHRDRRVSGLHPGTNGSPATLVAEHGRRRARLLDAGRGNRARTARRRGCRR